MPQHHPGCPASLQTGKVAPKVYEFPGPSIPITILLSHSSRDPDTTASVCVCGSLVWEPPQPKDPFHTSALISSERRESGEQYCPSCFLSPEGLKPPSEGERQVPLLPQLWALCSEPAPCGLCHHSPSHLAPPFLPDLLTVSLPYCLHLSSPPPPRPPEPS